jgi:fatty acid desaturase
MKKNVYEQYFSQEQLYDLKASQISELREREQALTFTVFISIFLTFATFILLVALFLWFNKLTIFLYVIVFVPNILVYVIYYKLITKHLKTINFYKREIKGETSI